jgi:GNAT superfamily N-acetyltransferase
MIYMSLKTVIKDHFQNNLIIKHGDVLTKSKNSYVEFYRKKKIIIVREFIWSDLEECSQLFKQVFNAEPWYDKWTSLNQVKSYIYELTENPAFQGFVVFEGPQMVAVCLGHRRSWWKGKEFFVDEFFVKNNIQGNGIGTRTLDVIKKILIKEGYARINLLTNKDIPAEKFYLKNGFKKNINRTFLVKEFN